ncbi:AraC family transcriptional regulator [Rhizobium sp. R635]|uniref:helix-turn-helix transcriptional regulator n=1 Tax=Rhizobium sp. R635 TaxID=1764275 RepID=UPI000B52A4D6|nr:AraC family transcriptional regulator [Rhizobium sp. R635]OWV87603.1 AraC family transcriptional regulator [Rhizobium sp. R635]
MNNSADVTPPCAGANAQSMFDTLAEVARLEATPTNTLTGFSWTADGWSNGTMTSARFECNGELKCRPTSDAPAWLAVYVPRHGICGIGRRDIQAIASPGQILVGHNHEVDHFLVGGAFHRSEKFFLDWSVISKAFVDFFDAPLSGSLDLAPVVDDLSHTGPLFKNLTETLICGMREDGGLRQSPLAMASLTEAFAHLLVGSVRHRYPGRFDQQRITPAPWHVRRAIDFMQENISTPITISTVAQSINVSVRALENGFRNFKGETPANYLRMLRVQAVRQDLLDASNRQSVKTICLKWGFFHPGRFSAFYKSVYGETPQQTKMRQTR